MSKIVVRDLKKIYNMGQPNEVYALRGVNFEIENDEFAVILGPSGSGKSTVLNILGGMDFATSGDYFVDGDEISKFDEKKLTAFRRYDIGFVFQFYNLIANLTALENVQLAATVAKDPFDAYDILKKVGLSDRIDNYPPQLSGGEQQRTAIARALVKKPRLLLCDEPTGALDSKTGEQIVSLLYSVCKSYGITVVIVSHNVKIADCAEHVIHIVDGAVVKDVRPEKPLTPDEVKW